MSNMLYELREMLMHELKDASEYNSKMTKERLEIIDMITHSLKNIDKLIMSDKYVYQNEGNSYGTIRYSYANDGYSNNGYGNSYGHPGNSYGYNGNSYGHWNDPDMRYSRDDGKSNMIHCLEDMMSRAQTDKEREAIKMCLDKMKS